MNLANKYILGNLVISTQKGLKNILGFNNIPTFLIPVIKLYFRILGKVRAKKQFKFTDYVKIAEADEEIEYNDPLRIDSYPMSMISSLININTINLTNPKEKIKEEIYVIAGSKDPIFSINLQKEAFNLIKAEKKHFIEVDTDQHMMYTEYPEKLSKIIYKEVIYEKEY